MNHIDISKKEQITSVSAGTVTPTWDATAGKRRQDAIKEARDQAWAEHLQAKSNTLEDRLDRLELAFAALQREVMKGGKE